LDPVFSCTNHCAYHISNKHDENDLVKPIEKPEAKDDRNEHQSRPHDPPECPIIRLRRWLKCHPCPTVCECLKDTEFCICISRNFPVPEAGPETSLASFGGDFCRNILRACSIQQSCENSPDRSKYDPCDDISWIVRADVDTRETNQSSDCIQGDRFTHPQLEMVDEQSH
jgi:hypothetical protein